MGNRHARRFEYLLRGKTVKTIIEVGANWGTDTERLAADGSRVYAFEPTPSLADHLRNKFRANTQVTVVCKAVDEHNGIAEFNIAGTGDWGCSSLYNFSEDIHEKWEGRPDFHFTDKCEVETIRLDTFIHENEIDKVDYLWVDAQGNDFKVLKSLGDEIHRVVSGKCEGAFTVDLYEDADNSVDDIKNWLESNGFSCVVMPDNVNKEADIHFKRR